jgi:tRNA 2-thiocytidine biosynthesis protein TtcA
MDIGQSHSANEKKIKSFCKHVGRAINRFRMISSGDRILVGVSGGKDSLALCFALAERRKWVPISYELLAVHIDWMEYPLPPAQKLPLQSFLDELAIPLIPVRASIFGDVPRRRFDCYRCSRNRKRILFETAAQQGCRKIALGHTMDDVVETTLMNLAFGGEFSTMMPVQSFFGDTVTLIRPMVEVKEREVADIAGRLALPTVDIPCPNKDTNRRLLMKEIIKQLSRANRRVRENIFRSPWHINTRYLPPSLEATRKPL